jgi:hypothetical protein
MSVQTAAQVINDLMLLALQPTDQRRNEQLQRKHGSSLRQLPATFSDTTRPESAQSSLARG